MMMMWRPLYLIEYKAKKGEGQVEQQAEGPLLLPEKEAFKKPMRFTGKREREE